jgi:hypothetical protein
MSAFLPRKQTKRRHRATSENAKRRRNTSGSARIEWRAGGLRATRTKQVRPRFRSFNQVCQHALVQVGGQYVRGFEELMIFCCWFASAISNS